MAVLSLDRPAAGRVFVALYLGVLAFAAASLPAAPASAYSVTTAAGGGKSVKRWFSNKISYHINPIGSDDLPFSTVQAELTKGFAGWMEPSCTGLEFTPGYHCNTALGKCLYDKNVACKADSDCPASTNKKVMPIGYNANGRNELVFIEDSSWKHGNFVLGVTVAWDNNWQGAITESDIAFNGYLQKWTTDPNKAGNGTQHLLSVAIHEQGHFFGVMHVLGGWNQADPPTMAPNVMPYGISASLSADDKKASCFLNPKSTHSCSNDSDCPYVVQKSSQSGSESYGAKLVCKSGSCVWGAAPVQGQTTIGGTCSSDNDCKSGLFCQPIGNGTSYCAQTCTVSKANCPSGFTCYPYQGNTGQGVCLAPFGGGAKKGIGETCAAGNDCQSFLCVGGTCKQPCTVGGSSCPSGQICEAVPGSGGACVDKAEPSLKDLNEECFAPEECGSGVCMKDDLQSTVGYCRLICTAPGSCPDGFQCVSQGEGYTGCIPGKESIPSGQPCTKDAMCEGNICVPAAELGSLCSNVCTLGDTTGCPCGMVCANGVKGVACYLGQPKGCLPDGTPCTGDVECSSGICLAGACRPKCKVGADVGCDLGLSCLRLDPGGADGRCAQPGQVPVGNFCVADEVCATLLCAKDSEDVSRCSDPCIPGDAATCPAGSGCVQIAPGYGRCQQGATGTPGPDTTGGGDAVGDGVAGGDTTPTVGGGYVPAPQSSSCSAAPAGRGASWPAGMLWVIVGCVVWIARRRTLAA